jgi:hypothetical protein
LSDLETFSAYESSNQGSSPESFRLFQERMKVASAQIQAIRAGEQKQKKKEDELARILSEFIKTLQSDSDHAGFIVHITKLLALNLPAAFILSLIIINFPRLQEQTGLKLLSFEEAARAGALDAPTLPDLYMAGPALPPPLKIALDSWIQEISRVSQEQRQKLLQRGVGPAGRWHAEIQETMSFSLSHYLEQQGFPINSEFSETFCRFCLDGMLKQLMEQLPGLNEPLTSL